MMTHISTAIPTYNNQNTIERCIESILNQTKNFDEIILVDDGSTDSASKIMKKFPVKMIRIEHKGRPGSRPCMDHRGTSHVSKYRHYRRQPNEKG